MNGVHDLGGMHGFGPVTPASNEPVFHADWERRTFALALATMGSRRVNVDEFRRVIERMPPAAYLATSYYEHWLYALEALLVEKQLIGPDEIDTRLCGDGGSSSPLAPVVAAVADEGAAALWSNPNAAAPRSSAVALRHNPKFKARFKPGERIIARNLNPEGHTRIPRYVRGRRGVIRHDWGTFVFPDTHAHSAGTNPQHCYGVEFSARELWGAAHPARERVYVDLWEGYLLPDEVPAAQAKPTPAPPMARKTIAKAAAEAPQPQAKKAPLKKAQITRATAKRVPPAKSRTSKRVSRPR